MSTVSVTQTPSQSQEVASGVPVLTGLPSPRTPLDYALRYLAGGWAVVPLHSVRKGRCTCPKGADCPTPGKHPCIPTWRAYQVQRPTAEEVRAWWSRWPQANVGVLTGGISGIICLDVDGPEGLEALQARGYALPPTAVSRTGRGWHYVFRHPGGVVPNAVKLLPGVDLRGDGGLFVTAPSVHASGRRYQWELTPDKAGIADPPAWLLEAIRHAPSPAKAHRLTPEDWSRDIPEGQRNTELTRRAGSLLAGGKMEPAEALTMLLAWNQAHCKPPLPEDEVRRIVASIARAEAAKGGGDEGLPVRRTPQLIRLADVEVRPVEALWEPYIFKRTLTILDGDPGLGKSYLSLQIAAAVTRGWPLPGQDGVPQGGGEPANVILLASEDGPGDTIRPRLEKAGADLERVLLLTGTREEPDRPLFLATDLDVLDAACEQVKPALVIIDPLQAFLGPEVDLHRANETRPVLAALARLAERHNCAVLVIRHLSKSAEGRAIYRGLGSIDLAAAARSVLLVGPHPDNPNVRVLAHVKCNLAPKGVSLTFTIGPDGFEWLGADATTADRLVGPPTDPEEKSRLEEAVEFLQEQLADGPKPAKAVKEAAREADIAPKTLRRAKEALGVKARFEAVPGGKRGDGTWIWYLPKRDPWETEGDPVARPAPHPSKDHEGQDGQDGQKAVMTLFDRPAHSPWDEQDGRSPSRQRFDRLDRVAHTGEQGAKTDAPRGGQVGRNGRAPQHYPSATADGRCGVCGEDSWRPTTDGRLLCSRCHPPVDLWQTA